MSTSPGVAPAWKLPHREISAAGAAMQLAVKRTSRRRGSHFGPVALRGELLASRSKERRPSRASPVYVAIDSYSRIPTCGWYPAWAHVCPVHCYLSLSLFSVVGPSAAITRGCVDRKLWHVVPALAYSPHVANAPRRRCRVCLRSRLHWPRCWIPNGRQRRLSLPHRGCAMHLALASLPKLQARR